MGPVQRALSGGSNHRELAEDLTSEISPSRCAGWNRPWQTRSAAKHSGKVPPSVRAGPHDPPISLGSVTVWLGIGAIVWKLSCLAAG